MHPAPAKGMVLWAQLEELGRPQITPGGLQDRNRQEGPGGEVSLLLLYGDAAPLTQSCCGDTGTGILMSVSLLSWLPMLRW